MKNAVLVFSLIFSCHFGYAQVWGHSGAQWHYDYGLFFGGLITINYTGDTLVDGSTAQKFNQHGQEFYPQQNGTILPGAEWDEMVLTRYSGDSVFWRFDEEFYLLYDFGASVGDSWAIANDHGADLFCDSISMVEVTNTGTIQINGQTLRYIDLVHLQGNLGLSGRVVERIGMVQAANPELSFLFPKYQNCDSTMVVDYYLYDFRCYNDNSFGEYNVAGEECDYLAIYAGLNELDSEISISPNPVKNKLTIKNGYPGFARYSIVDYHGKIWKEGDVYVGLGLDVSELPPGFYLLRLEKEGAEVSSAKFLKE